MDEKNNAPGISKRTLMVLVVIILAAVALFAADMLTKSSSSTGHYTLNVANGEVLTVAEVRAAVSQSALDGEGVMSVNQCNTLGDISKKLDSGSKWFSNCEYIIRGSTPDSDTDSVIKLSDGDYCATLTFNKDIDKLLSYDFVNGECGDSRLSIEQVGVE
jgi:preprotein translocase subunit SecF